MEATNLRSNLVAYPSKITTIISGEDLRGANSETGRVAGFLFLQGSIVARAELSVECPNM